MPPRKSSVEATREALRARAAQPVSIAERPSIGLPDPLEAAQEAARLAREGNHKLCGAVDALRTALETIVIAEYDSHTRAPTTTADLRKLAIEGLNAYSALTGQSWRRNKLIGSYAGDRNIGNAEKYDG